MNEQVFCVCWHFFIASCGLDLFVAPRAVYLTSVFTGTVKTFDFTCATSVMVLFGRKRFYIVFLTQKDRSVILRFNSFVISLVCLPTYENHACLLG
jgi:hypothetical protein